MRRWPGRGSLIPRPAGRRARSTRNLGSGGRRSRGLSSLERQAPPLGAVWGGPAAPGVSDGVRDRARSQRPGRGTSLERRRLRHLAARFHLGRAKTISHLLRARSSPGAHGASNCRRPAREPLSSPPGLPAQAFAAGIDANRQEVSYMKGIRGCPISCARTAVARSTLPLW